MEGGEGGFPELLERWDKNTRKCFEKLAGNYQPSAVPAIRI